jgi:hypothetical protein
MKLPGNLDELAAKARDDISKRTLSKLQQDTAIAWAVRAVAAMTLYRETGDSRWWYDGDEYFHEAIEHAALSGDIELLTDIRLRLSVFVRHSAST